MFTVRKNILSSRGIISIIQITPSNIGTIFFSPYITIPFQASDSYKKSRWSGERSRDKSSRDEPQDKPGSKSGDKPGSGDKPLDKPQGGKKA